MNAKKAKKLRQMYKRNLLAEAKKRLEKVQELVRPKPKFIPKIIWKKIVFYVLNIK